MRKTKTLNAAELHIMVTEECAKMVDLAAKHSFHVSAKRIQDLREGAASLVVVEQAKPEGVDVEDLKVDVMVALNRLRDQLKGMISKKADEEQLRKAARQALGQRAGKHAAMADPDKVRSLLRKKKKVIVRRKKSPR